MYKHTHTIYIYCSTPYVIMAKIQFNDMTMTTNNTNGIIKHP